MTMLNSRFVSDTKAPNVLFMPGVFNETMQLLTDAREYFHRFGLEDQQRLAADVRSLYSCEMSRITLRLSAIMAWLMAQRAAFSGKIPSADLPSRYRLDFKDICMVDNRMLHGILPSYVCYLLDNSLELYQRVLRLDHQSSQATIH